MIGCKACPWVCAEYVRNAQGDQRSGYRLLMAHWSQQHGKLPRHKWPFRNSYLPSTVDDRCFNCDGRGCEACEPGGTAETWNFNTLERLEHPNAK